MTNEVRRDRPKSVWTTDPITKQMRKYSVGDIYQVEWIQPDSKEKRISNYKIIGIAPWSNDWVEGVEQFFSFFYSEARYYRGLRQGPSALKIRGRGYSE